MVAALVHLHAVVPPIMDARFAVGVEAAEAGTAGGGELTVAAASDATAQQIVSTGEPEAPIDPENQLVEACKAINLLLPKIGAAKCDICAATAATFDCEVEAVQKSRGKTSSVHEPQAKSDVATKDRPAQMLSDSTITLFGDAVDGGGSGVPPQTWTRASVRQQCAVVDILSAVHTHIPQIALAQVAGQLVRAPASIPARS